MPRMSIVLRAFATWAVLSLVALLPWYSALQVLLLTPLAISWLVVLQALWVDRRAARRS